MFKLITIFFSGKVISQGINFLSTIMLISYLSVENFGKFSFTLEIIMIFVAVLEIGTRSIYIRDLSSSKFQLVEIIKFHRILVLFFILISFFFVSYFSDLGVYFALFLCITAIISTIQVPFVSDLISKSKAGMVSKIEVFIASSKFFLFAIVVYLEQTWQLFLFYFILGFVVFLFVLPHSFSKIFSNIQLLKRGGIDSNLKSSVVPMMFVALLSILYNKIDILMLEGFLGYQSVGEYSAIYRLILPFLFVSSSVFLVLLPMFSDGRLHSNNVLKISSILFFVGLALSVCLSLSFWFITSFFLFQYAHLIFEFIVYSLYLPVVFSYGVISNFLVSKGKLSIIIFVTFSALFLNVFANYFLIPKLGVMGAILSTVLSEVLIFSCYQYLSWSKKLE